MLQLIKLERGLVSFESDGTFLTAQPDGTVVIANRWCSLWEFFLPMETGVHRRQPTVEQRSP